MFTLKFVRENVDLIKKNIEKRGQLNKLDLVDELLKLDEDYLKLLKENQDLRALRNKLTIEINKLRKEGKDFKLKIKDVKDIPQKISKTDEELDSFRIKIDSILYQLPNLLDKSVGTKNKIVEKWGEPKKKKTVNHYELAEKLSVLDCETSAKVTGNGFYYLKGSLARLNMALIQFAIETLTKKGFTYVEPPLMLRKKVCDSVIDMDFFKEHVYKIEGEDLYLIGTSEHPLIAMYMNEIIREKDLPLKLCGYSMCFRKEIGAHGIDEKGIFRTHQFNKVEQIVICNPSESDKLYEEILKNSTFLLKKLKLPYRVVQFGAKEVGDWKSKYADIEVWSSRKNDYIETMSCSNLTDFQSRKLGIKVEGHGEVYYPHTLNNTGIATSRILVAILENNQTTKGTVKVPSVLVPYMGGVKEIK